MNRSDSSRSRPLQTRITAGLRLSYRIRPGHPTEVGERQDVAFQERLLRLRGERDVKRPARLGQPHHEHPALHRHPGDPWRRTRRSRPRPRRRARCVCGHRTPHLRPGRSSTRRRATYRDTVTSDTAAPCSAISRCHTRRAVWRCFLGTVPVRRQPAVDHLDPRIDRRPRPGEIRLPRRRHRTRPTPAAPSADAPVPLGELPDRQPLDPPVPPDLLEHFHPRPRHYPTSAPATPTRRSQPEWGQH